MKQHPNMQTTLNSSLSSLQHKPEKHIISEYQSQQNLNLDQIGQKYIDFNKNNARKGADYEKVVEKDLIERGYTDIIPGLWPTIPGKHPTRIFFKDQLICSVDFTATNTEGITEYIEAKGGITGTVNNQRKQTAGAMRIDSVKKALWNGRLIKRIVPNSIYIIYFSQSPKKGSPTDVMIQAALEFGDLDEVRYLEFHETTN